MIHQYKKFRKDLTANGLKLINFVNLNDDKKRLVLDWRNHENVRDHMLTNHIITKEEHFDFIEKLKKNRKHFCWLVEKDKRPIGVVALHDVDFENKHCYSGVYADPCQENMAVGFLLLKTIITLAFSLFRMHSLRGSTIGDNPILYIHKKLGLKEVGKYTDYLLRNGKWHTVIITEMINTEH